MKIKRELKDAARRRHLAEKSELTIFTFRLHKNAVRIVATQFYTHHANMAAPMESATSNKMLAENIEKLTEFDDLKKAYDKICKDEVTYVFVCLSYFLVES